MESEQIVSIGKDVLSRISRVQTQCPAAAADRGAFLMARYHAAARFGNLESPWRGCSGLHADAVGKVTGRPGGPTVPPSPGETIPGGGA